MKMRLNKYISLGGNYSRREADRMIDQKRVTLNGNLASKGMIVDIENDIVEVDYKRIKSEIRRNIYLLVYKPKNIITSRKDDKNRKTIMDIVPDKYKLLKPAGRLDFDTEGLLILTNDGDFINYITHPANKIEKRYEAKIFGRLNDKEINVLKKGIKIENERYYFNNVKELHYIKSTDKSKIEIILDHGKKNEIKEALKKMGHPVITLKRTAIGSLNLNILKNSSFAKFDKSIFREKMK